MLSAFTTFSENENSVIDWVPVIAGDNFFDNRYGYYKIKMVHLQRFQNMLARKVGPTTYANNLHLLLVNK